MHRATKLSATVMMGLALAAAPAWVNAADEKKSTTEAVKTNVSDSWITSKAKIALFADSRVPGTSVNVETQKGTLYLRGKVDTDAAKQAAEEIAKGVDGVKSVKNELQVVPAGDKKMVEAKDEDLTKQVKTRFQNDARLKKVDVRVDNGVVTLQGKVANIDDSARASQLARSVPGERHDLRQRDGRFQHHEGPYEPDEGDDEGQDEHDDGRLRQGDGLADPRGGGPAGAPEGGLEPGPDRRLHGAAHDRGGA